MRVITYKRLLDFAVVHPESSETLNAWYRTVKRSYFADPAALQATFGQVDYVKGLFVFNIGKPYRLVAAIHFRGQRLYVRHVLTHAEYDRGKWKPK